MPFIEVTLAEGRTPEQLRALQHELTQAAHRAVGAPIESIRVVVREVPTTHWSAGDVTIAERRGEELSSMEFYGHIIDGQEVESVDGARWTSSTPSPASRGRRSRSAAERTPTLAVAAARRAFDEGPWPRMGYEKRQALHAPARRPHGGARRRARARRHPRHGQADHAGPPRRRPLACGTSGSSPTTRG